MSVERTILISAGMYSGVASLISVTCGECIASSNCENMLSGNSFATVATGTRW